MSGAWKWIAVLAFVMVGLVVVGSAASGVAAAVKNQVTYNVQFTESGLTTGTTWYVTFNSVAYSSSGTSLSITGLTGATNYYWYLTTAPTNAGAQYIGTPSSGYIYVNAQLHQYVVFQKQDSLAFTILPATSPTAGTITPSNGFYNHGGKTVINAVPNVGFTFSKWTSSSTSLTFANALSQSTVLSVGAAGTITAHFNITKTKLTFTEQGLSPTALALGWTVTFASSPYFSSTATLTTPAVGVGSYSWSIAPVSVAAGDQFAAFPSSGSVALPYTSTINIQFIEQFQVTFTVGTGTGTGTISPSGTQWYNTGSEVALSSTASTGSLFKSWAGPAGLYLGSTTLSATNITVTMTGTITATFKTGTQCNPSATPSTCTATITEWGLPASTTWGVSINSVLYTSSTPTITIPNVVANYVYPTSPVGTSSSTTVYYPASSYGYLYVPGMTSMEVIYTPYYYVTLATTGSSNYILYQSSGWYPAKSVVALNTQTSAYAKFSKWTTTGGALTLSTATKPSTFMTVGAAGTITDMFTTPNNKIVFVQSGMPVGTGWGVSVNSIYYYSSGWTLNVSGIASYAYVSWAPISGISAGSAGTEYQAIGSYSYLNVPFQLVQQVVYAKFVSVTVTQTGGGTTTPSSTTWYANGTMIALSGINGTTVHFKSWSAAPAANVAFGSTTQAATTATFSGPATITGKFA